MSKDDIQIQKGPAVPLSQLPTDATHAKFLQTAGYVDEPLGSSGFVAQDLHMISLIEVSFQCRGIFGVASRIRG